MEYNNGEQNKSDGKMAGWKWFLIYLVVAGVVFLLLSFVALEKERSEEYQGYYASHPAVFSGSHQHLSDAFVRY